MRRLQVLRFFIVTWWPVILFAVALAAISCGLVYEPGGKVLQ